MLSSQLISTIYNACLLTYYRILKNSESFLLDNLIFFSLKWIYLRYTFKLKFFEVEFTYSKSQPFKKQWFFSTLTTVTTKCQNKFHTLKRETPHLLSVTPRFFPETFQSWAATNLIYLLSLWICLLWAFCINGTI